jgi:hypothetical protein
MLRTKYYYYLFSDAVCDVRAGLLVQLLLDLSAWEKTPHNSYFWRKTKERSKQRLASLVAHIVKSGGETWCTGKELWPQAQVSKPFLVSENPQLSDQPTSFFG